MKKTLMAAALAVPVLGGLGVGLAKAAPSVPARAVETHSAPIVKAGYYVPTCIRVPIVDNFGLIVGWTTVCG